MYIVGLFLIVDPECFDLVAPDIETMCHVEIKYSEPDSGQIMLSVYGDNEQQDKQIIEKIRSLPFVITAEIIYFQYYDELDTGSGVDNITDKSSRTYKSFNYILHTQH